MTERLIVIGGGGAGISAGDHRQAARPRPARLALHRVRGHRLLAVRDPVRATAARSRASRTSSSRRSSATSSDGLDMRMETVVTDIDLDRGTITARNQHEGFDKLIVATGFVWEKPDVPGANLEGLHYVKNIRKAMEFDKVLETVKTRRRGRRHAARRRDGGQPRPPRPRGRTSSTRARGCSHEVLDPDVAEPVHESLDQARRHAAPGHRGRGASWATTTCARWRPRRARSPATS